LTGIYCAQYEFVILSLVQAETTPEGWDWTNFDRKLYRRGRILSIECCRRLWWKATVV